MYYYQRLKDLREDADKSQAEIARILEISQQHYSQYERGGKCGMERGDYAPAQGENELPRRRLMLFQPVPAGQFVFLPPSTIHFMSKKIFVKVRKGRSKNAAGDAFFDLPFLFPLTKNELQGQFFLLLTKRIAPRAGKRKKPGTRAPTAVPGSGVKETKPRTIIIQAQKGNVNYERDNENQQNRRIP